MYISSPTWTPKSITDDVNSAGSRIRSFPLPWPSSPYWPWPFLWWDIDALLILNPEKSSSTLNSTHSLWDPPQHSLLALWPWWYRLVFQTCGYSFEPSFLQIPGWVRRRSCAQAYRCLRESLLQQPRWEMVDQWVDGLMNGYVISSQHEGLRV